MGAENPYSKHIRTFYCYCSCSSQSLLARYGQIDIDDETYRKSAARKVGLELPKGPELQARDLGAKYDLSKVKADSSKQHGVQSLKAQLYGLRGENVEKVRQNLHHHQHDGDQAAEPNAEDDEQQEENDHEARS